MRWHRAPGQNSKRFDLYSELAFLANTFMLPYVINLVTGSNDGFWIYLAILLEFEMLTDPNETCER